MERIELYRGLKKDYIIPCFQREYSWGKEEIEKLISDIKSLKPQEKYCLGIITVKEDNKGNFLIDGQQRLTTLYMIAIWCDYIKNDDEIRLSSEYNTLTSEKNNLNKILDDKKENDKKEDDKKDDDLPQVLEAGWNIIKQEIKENDKKDMREIIRKNLYYYEINLDNNTDLNHYFEVINSRGVQLSRSDIVKSNLMKLLNMDEDKDKYMSCLNHLWYEYEKMDSKTDKYKKFTDILEQNNEIINEAEENDITKKEQNIEYKTINEIINEAKENDITKKDQNNKDKNSQYDIKDENSILNFEYFLLYVIRLYKNRNELDKDIQGEFNLNNLIEEYEVFKRSEDVVEFLDFLISMKNIYDKYVVKYDRNNENWKLEIKSPEMILIQSCLRVSFVNSRLMHWVYKTLAFFYKNKDMKEESKIVNEYVKEMENYIRGKYIKDFIENNKEKDYKTGFDTPHIVLNYLDYLIKINEKDVKEKIPEAKDLEFNEFKFKYRDSIEHFMSRSLTEEEWVDDFGNIALLAYGTNTRMQNADSDLKAKHFQKELSEYSLKLQIMSKIALNEDRGWNENSCKYIREKCIEILKDDLNKK